MTDQDRPATGGSPLIGAITTQPPCYDCGAPETKRYRFMQVISYLIATSHRRWTVPLCPRCAARQGLRAQGLSLFLGWWGIPWGLMTIPALFINAWSLWRSNFVGRFFGLMLPFLVLVGLGSLAGRAKPQLPPLHDDLPITNYVYGPALEEVQTADRAERRGDLAAAITAMERARSVDPESIEIRKRLALLRLQRGDARAALGEIAAAESIGGPDPDLLLLAADCQDLLGAPAEELRCLRRALELRDETAIHLRLQQALIAQGEQAAALREYRARHEAAPGARNAYLMERLTEDASSRARLLAAIAPGPGDHADLLRRDLVAALIEIRDFAGAAAKAAELSPGARLESGELVAALVACGQGDFDRALKLLDAAIRAAPLDAAFLRQRFELHLHVHDLAAAEIDLAGLDRIPSWAPVMPLYRAELALEAGDDPACDRLLAPLLADRAQLHPFLWEWVVALGARARWLRGDPEQALETLDQAFGERPDLELPRLLILKGRLLGLAGRQPEARATFARVLACRSAAPRQGAEAALRLGRIEVEDYLARCRRGLPLDEASIDLALGLHHEARGDRVAAAAAYREALALAGQARFSGTIARRRLGLLER